MSIISYHKVAELNRKDIILFRVKNKSGAYIELINYGATLTSVVIPDRHSELRNVILNYNAVHNYFSDSYYLGSTIGRFANRISLAQFTLNKKTHLLDKNDGLNSIHGGFSGMNRKIFGYEVKNSCIKLSADSADGEGGFPGNLLLSVTYAFTETNEIIIDYEAVTDKPTPVNITNHAYFNLSAGSGNILSHKLKVFSTHHLEFDRTFLPTGNKLLLGESVGFDFRNQRSIRENMDKKTDFNLQGYNTYFISEKESIDELKPLAELKEDSTGICMQLKATMPGFMFYTGDFLSGTHEAFSGLCMEAQYYPDNVNHNHFPVSYADINKPWKERITYLFSNYTDI